MISFIKAAIREIDHVVWPTPSETQKYFTIVTIMIAVSTVIFFTFGTFVSMGMFAIRAVVPHDVSTTVNDAPIEDISSKIPKASQSVVSSGSTTSTGTAVTSGTATPKN